MRHELAELDSDPDAVARAQAESEVLVPNHQATVAVLVAEPSITEASYTQPMSLVWRDAGCLIATLQLVGEWLGLGVCPLGVLGGDLAASLDSRLLGAGMLLIGARIA